jgi:hypothetical protein
VAVDWSFAGIAACGEDLAPLVETIDGSFNHRREVAQGICESYLVGLSDTGWRGDPREIEFTYTAATAWRYIFGGMIGDGLRLLSTTEGRTKLEQGFGMPLEEIADTLAPGWKFRTYLANEALRLYEELD